LGEENLAKLLGPQACHIPRCFLVKDERKKILKDLAKAKGDLGIIQSNDSRLEKQLKQKIATLERELALLDLK
jgi:hypothetical protein